MESPVANQHKEVLLRWDPVEVHTDGPLFTRLPASKRFVLPL